MCCVCVCVCVLNNKFARIHIIFTGDTLPIIFFYLSRSRKQLEDNLRVITEAEKVSVVRNRELRVMLCGTCVEGGVSGRRPGGH